ncbi:MAG: hypothetical protein EKK63_02485 [Acinetobacter sp.]|uniref:hypothetical protein n=1 Tax=Acinetobacter sp. TaxID=472 RepID=UPI000FB99696|nr:hypothetical protein [Acinetobacter sp.]RUP42184.1 MAG: hypothetical protein EKK63_02485 [Acinetobacter sp.]
MAKITSDTTFPRSVTIKDKDGNEIFGWIMQPYITGMYIAYKSGSQGNILHSKVPGYLKKVQKTAEKEGHTVEIQESTYGAWVTKEELEKYYN